MIPFLLASVASAGPVHVERVAARHEATTIELLQRSTCRPGVPEQAIARYLDRWSALDTRPVRTIQAWGASLEPAPPASSSAEDPPAIGDGEQPLAVPVTH